MRVTCLELLFFLFSSKNEVYRTLVWYIMIVTRSDEPMIGMLKRALNEQSTIEIIYMSKGGIVTGRLIKVLDLTEKSLTAYCYLRKKRRTFLLENILSADVPRRRGKHLQAN